jgi:hypothetical protein
MATELFEHPFFGAVADSATPSLQRAAEHVRANLHREGEAQAENRRRMTQAERYATNVFLRTISIYNTLRALDDARRLIAIFPGQVGKGADAMTRDRWVDYHYGYFTVSLASLPDISLIVTSLVFQLGLANRHCKPDVITSHGAIKGSDVEMALRGLAKSVQSVKERRNKHVHQGDHADVETLAPGSFLRDLKTLTFLRSVDASLVKAEFLAEGWREARREMVPRLTEETELVRRALGVLFDALLPAFTMRLEALRTFETGDSKPVA